MQHRRWTAARPRAAAAAALLIALAGACCGSAAGGSTDPAWVTCGSTIKLAHAPSSFRLISTEVTYSRGSRQQSVTAQRASGDARAYFSVQGAPDAPCAPGQPVARGQRVRLQHAVSRKWLHSRPAFQSPLTGNQEVSLQGSDATSDAADVWEVDFAEPAARWWQQDARVFLKHAETRAYLHSISEQHFSWGPAEGHAEVCALDARSRDGEWAAMEGVYLPLRNGSDAGGGATVGRDEL